MVYLKFAFLPCLIALSGCAAVSPAGLVAASRLDPLETPPERIAIAISVPDEIRLKTGDATLALAFAADDGRPAAQVSETISLVIARGTGSDGPTARAGQTVYIATIAPDDAARLTAAQTRITALHDSGIEGAGSLSVGVSGGCHVGGVPDTLPVGTWLRTDPEGAFLPLTRPVDMFRSLDSETAQALRTNFAPC